MTQQCMLMQDEVMLSLSNTVVHTTGRETTRPELQYVVPNDYDCVKAGRTSITQKVKSKRCVRSSCK